MERTKSPTVAKRGRGRPKKPVTDLSICIPKSLMDKLLKQKNPDVISVFMFYLYTALWQNNDQPKATDKYCRIGLGIGYARFHEAQQILIRLKLIKRINPRKNGKISGWYIKIAPINQGPHNFVENNKVEADIKTAETPNSPLLSGKPNSRESTYKYNNTNKLNTELAETDVSALSIDVKKYRKKITPKETSPFIPKYTCGTDHDTDPGWRFLDNKKSNNRIIDDGILYVKCDDEYYRHWASGGEIYIE